MKIHVALLAIMTVAVAPLVPSMATDNRADWFALVIGNAKYPDAEAPLKEPINDAREVADELKRDGFSVEVGENLTGEAMRRAFDKLYGRIKPGSVALISFSAFGVQSGRPTFMIPAAAQAWTVGGGGGKGNWGCRLDGGGDGEPDRRRRHPSVAQRAGAMDFVLVGRGLFVYPGLWFRRQAARLGGGAPQTSARTAAVAARRPGAAAAAKTGRAQDSTTRETGDRQAGARQACSRQADGKNRRNHGAGACR